MPADIAWRASQLIETRPNKSGASRPVLFPGDVRGGGQREKDDYYENEALHIRLVFYSSLIRILEQTWVNGAGSRAKDLTFRLTRLLLG